MKWHLMQLFFIIGIVYGYMNPGKEDRINLLKKGAKIGVILAIIFSFLDLIVGGFLRSFATFIGITIGIFFITVLFTLGTTIGDWLESIIKRYKQAISYEEGLFF